MNIPNIKKISSFQIGILLILLGFVMLGIRALSGDYVDSAGILHENFFLVPISYIFSLSGLVLVIATAIGKIRKK